MMIFDNKSLIYDSDYNSIIEWSVRLPSLIEISNRHSRISVTSLKYDSGEYHIKFIGARFKKNRLKGVGGSHCKIRPNISIFSKNYSENHLNRKNYYLDGIDYSRPPLFLRKDKN
jgi:hypothetical protein